jgi:DNA-binding transcriptional MerR regulator/effector-binding domain-containing protein
MSKVGVKMKKDLLTIQEFSSLSGVEITTLRYWDEIGLFSPIKRDPENNYRYYSLAQIIALSFVTTLSDLKFPLKTIARLRKKRDPDEIMRLLDKRERQMDMEMRALRLRYSIIHARRELINYGVKIDETMISVLPRDDKSMILWPRNEYSEGDTFVVPLTSFVNKAGGQHVNLSFPVGGYHENMKSFLKNSGHPDHFFSIDPLGTHTRKAGDYLIGFARGYYGEMGDLPERMAAYAKKRSLTVSGPVYTMYLHDEICTQEPSNYLAQSCVAVSKSKVKKG